MLKRLLSTMIRTGTIQVIWPDGSRSRFGNGAPHATIRLRGRFTPVHLGLRPELAIGEAYMDGRLTVEEGDIADVVEILISNCETPPEPWVVRVARRIRRLWRPIAQFNWIGRSRRNVAHHYDLSGAMYGLFLDRDRQYSCAYFTAPGDSLEKAQAAKKRHIAAKLKLDRPGLKVLDIGSGWGGLALDLAANARADVLGVTLSTEQLAAARMRAAESGLAEHCRFELRDYRGIEGPFDRIVSVGMFEHVGVNYYREFFAKVNALLADDGTALIHTIGRMDGSGSTNPWITKYIFPGGYVPALSEILAATERSGLYVTDVEVLRLHYAETLKAWRARFARNRAKIAALYDERFCRMWEFYLAGSEMTFRHGHHGVFQIQIAKRVDSLPLTRDYMFDNERALRFPRMRADEAA